ncbi:sulfatase-like hydrolase/transferase [Prosthecobacter sp. SYSU 5D2]|uniref:sulfatase-like hydrolase/transferase n=1 Tax=Prosthecobacter sp. SYSU 5D2 TaxID=3134134 RepID=UPI0031FF0D65
MYSKLLVLCACLLPISLSAAEKPNILFLFADDYTYDAVRHFEKTDIETPNLDRLAERSKVFTHAYNMGSWSGAVCVASRTMLNTGKHVWRAQQVNLPQAQKEGQMWSQRMAAHGYETLMTGKWHVAVPADKCFGRTANVRGGMPKDTPAAYNRPIAGQPDVWSPSDPAQGGFWQGGKHWSEVTADDAVGFLQSGLGKTKPFFMYVAFNAPHDPRQAPAEYVSKYPLDRIAIPASYQPEYPYKKEIGCYPLRDEKLAPFPRTEFAVKTHRAEYYALITHLDAQIGRILAALDASGQAENTWIFFTADHGLAVGKHGLLGKQNMYEHSLRVPFMVKGPGVQPGKVGAPIYLQDVMATSLDLAGGKPQDVEFKSLLPLIRDGSSAPTAAPVYGAYLNLQRAIIADGWKLIAYPVAKKLRLYHVTEDPDELHDLAGQAEQKERVKTLFKQLRDLQKKMEDPLDLTAVFPEL